MEMCVLESPLTILQAKLCSRPCSASKRPPQPPTKVRSNSSNKTKSPFGNLERSARKKSLTKTGKLDPHVSKLLLFIHHFNFLHSFELILFLVKVLTEFNHRFALTFFNVRLILYRDGLKGGPVLLSYSQAGPGRHFSQPRAHLIVNICAYMLRMDRRRLL